MNNNILIFSDQAIHWNIVPAADRKNVYWETWGESSTKRFFNYLKPYFDELGFKTNWTILETGLDNLPLDQINPANNALNHSFATWRQFNEGKNKVWRIQDIVHIGQTLTCSTDGSILDFTNQADLLLVQDWGMDIRDLELSGLSKTIAGKWVIYRAYPPIFQGNLWNEISQSAGSKKIIILRADDLRKLNSSISKGLSWEQTLQDIINEIYIKKNISLYPLRKFEYVILSFGCTATLLLHNNPDDQNQAPDIQFFFDSMGIEGYWEKAHPGYLPGDLELLATLLTKEVLCPEVPNQHRIDRAIRAHLLSRRALITSGANVAEGSLALNCIPTELNKIYGKKTSSDFSPVELDFSLFESILANESGEKSGSLKKWSLLSMTKWDLYSLARMIALFGPMKALQSVNIPIAKYNYLLTVDRKEIEFLHHLKSLISEYLLSKNNQPLSIAVFGSPGSGKSFSIKQLAKALDLPDQEVKDVTFNLSQFNENDPSGLYQAFHVVRDIALSGKTPLVFWDEFDSKNLAWLRYFLAPMQDGEFQEGQLTHNIGKSIFVFAGGTCSCMEEFEQKAHQSVAEKGPDFLSRVKGFINVMGPNPLLPYSIRVSGDDNPVDENTQMSLARNADPEFIIRRAILINSLLQINYKHLFKDGVLQIDDGVLNAFLEIPKYRHGTRSMETIFRTSQLFGKEKYNRSDLPPESQMNLHVDGQQFYKLMTEPPQFFDGGKAFYHLVNEITFDEKVIEKIAVGIHAIYALATSEKRSETMLSISREEFLAYKEKLKNLPEEMPHDQISQNYHSARKIPEKLAAVGFSIIPLDPNRKPDAFTDLEFEKVSRLEHIRWVRHHINAGWIYAPIRNDANKHHNALIAWDENDRLNAESVYGKSYAEKMGLASGETLNERYHNLDRVITMAIPWLLEDAGYMMVRNK